MQTIRANVAYSLTWLNQRGQPGPDQRSPALSVEQIAQILNVSPQEAARLIRRGKLANSKDRRRYSAEKVRSLAHNGYD